MATATKVAPKAIVLPDIEVGSVVAWYPPGKGSGEWTPALVVRKNMDSLSLSGIVKDGPYLDCRPTACTHVDDKDATEQRVKDYGRWDYLPQEMALRKAILELEKRIIALESRD